MSKPTAIVLSSGGLHSLVTAGLAAREYRIALLHLKDGRVSGKLAAEAFDRQVTHFRPLKSWAIEAGYLRQMLLSPETAGMTHSTGSDAQAGLIPLRELQLLSVAAGFAQQLRASTIMWGVQFDQRASEALAKNVELVQLMNQFFELMNPPGAEPLELKTPLMGLEDGQVVELAYQLGLPFGASWSCQMPSGESPCMACPACVRRIRAFRAAQLPDPVMAKK